MEHAVKNKRRRTGATVKISSKNQITLPVAVLEKARLGPGAHVVIAAEAPGRITVRGSDDELADYVGSLPGVWPEGTIERLRDEWP